MQDLYQKQIALEEEPCIDHGYTGDRGLSENSTLSA